MTDKTDKPAKSPGRDDKSNWSSTAMAGAAIGSAALTAALLYVSRRKENGKVPLEPVHPEAAPETD